MIEKFYPVILIILRRILGVLIILLGLALISSIISYRIDDPSLNSGSSNGQVKNILGIFGAYASDIMLQTVGLASIMFSIIIAKIGFKLASKNGDNLLIYKIILAPFAVLSFATALAIIPQPQWWLFNSFGGYNGLLILNSITQIEPYFTAIIALCGASILFAIILEINWRDVYYFWRYFHLTAKFLIGSIFSRLIVDKNKKSTIGAVSFGEEVNNIENIKLLDDALIGFVSQDNANNTAVDEKQALKKELKNIRGRKSGNNQEQYKMPQSDLLVNRSEENRDKKVSREVVDSQSKMLAKVLEDFGVRGEAIGARVGPIVTLHEFEPSAGTKASRIIGLADDIARSMSAISTRISVILGKTSIGIELPNPKKQIIFLRELIESKEYKFSSHSLPMILGKDISGEITIADLAKMPHLLIAGTTGSGKSVGLNVMILSLLFKLKPSECKFIMIDPKMLELSVYDGIPHLLSPVVTEASKAIIALKWVVAEMEERYRLMSSFAVRNIAGYNEKAEKAMVSGEKLTRKVQTGYDASTGQPIIEEIEFEPKKIPFIVVVVDEMADLMLVAGKEIEGSVQRLAQMARAAGIHLIMATQRPSVDVITGVIKANFPTRISFQVTSRIDSRTILGTQGAEQLLGQGDMIYLSGGSKMTRVHGPFCSDVEIEDIVNFIKSQNYNETGEESKISFDVPIPTGKGQVSDINDFNDNGNGDDALYQQALAIVRRDKKTSISYVQRQLRIGYNRAAIIIERMEQEGVLTTPNISGKRELIEE